jgi:hypothetical protein
MRADYHTEIPAVKLSRALVVGQFPASALIRHVTFSVQHEIIVRELAGRHVYLCDEVVFGWIDWNARDKKLIFRNHRAVQLASSYLLTG